MKFEACDSKGAVVAGDKNKEVLVRDIWVFEKSQFHSVIAKQRKMKMFPSFSLNESDKSTANGIRCLLCHLVICNQVFDSIMVNLAAHATKTVKLGSQNGVIPQNHCSSNLGTKVKLLGDNNNRASLFVSEVQDNNLSSSVVTKNIEKGSSERKSRAPKKMVSINDKVEEFYMNNKRKRMVEKWPSMDDQNKEIKPFEVNLEGWF
ncbi:hypothetical protein OROHE_002272 [Orobanche hederae]